MKQNYTNKNQNNPIIRLMLFLLLVGGVSLSGWGQTPFTMSLTDLNNGTNVDTKTYVPLFDPSTPEYATSPTHNVATNFTQVGGLGHGTGTASYANWTGWDDQDRFFYYSITAAEGYQLTISAINSNLRSSNTGPRHIAVETATSLAGPWTERVVSNLTNSNNTDVNVTDLSITVEEDQTLYIRYRNTSETAANSANPVGSTGTHRLNSGSIVGTFESLDLPLAESPAFTPLGGIYTTPQDVSLSSITPDATIYYTINGDDPDDQSTEFTTDITVSVTTTIKAIAYAPGFDPSPVATANYYFPEIIKWAGDDLISKSWNDANNWNPNRVPHPAATVVLDNTNQVESYEVILPAGSEKTEVASLEISPDAEKTITLVLPNDNTANPGLDITGTGDALVINNGAVFRNSTGASAGSGFVLSDNGANIRINNGGRYIHNTVRAHAAAIVAKLSTVAGTETGIFEFAVPGGAEYALSITNRIYGSLVLSSAASRIYTGTGGGSLTIRGDLEIGNNVTFTPDLEGDMQINGDLTIVDGGALTISNRGKMEVAGSVTNSAGNTGLLIQSDNTGTGSLIHNSAGVAATVERYFATAETWRLISSPVVEQEISGNWIPSGGYNDGTGYDFYAWDEAEQLWRNKKVPENDIDNFIPGQGYLVSFQSVPHIPKFIDELNYSDVVIAVTKTGTGVFAGANLIGNPYASGIDWNKAVRTLFEDNFAYVYDRTSNAEGVTEGYLPIDGSLADAFIAPHQGFFVLKENTGSSDFTFTNAMRVHGGTFTKQQPMGEALVLRLSGDTYYDQATLRIHVNSGFERDRQDARKFFSYNQQAPQMYSLTSDNVRVSINSIPHIDEEQPITLGMRIPTEGEYTLSLQELTGAFANENVYLTDLLLDKTVELGMNMDYTFIATPDDDANRFLLHFSPIDDPTNIEDIDAPSVKLWFSNNTLFVNSHEHSTSLEVYDISGRRLQSHQLNAGEHRLELNLPAGVYIVQSSGNSHHETMKIIIQ